MSLMEELYGKVYRKTWKGKDYIIYRYGKLRPKDFGEILFSEEWNYLIYTLYYLHTVKHLIPPRVKFPQITRYIISITPTLAFLVHVTFKVPTEYLTKFSDVILPWFSYTSSTDLADIVNQWFSYSYATGFIDISRVLASLERYITWSGGPGTILGGEYRLELAMEIGIKLLGDAPYREARMKIEPTGDLRLGLLYRPGFIYYYRYSFTDVSLLTAVKELLTKDSDIVATILSKEIVSRFADVSRSLFTIGVEHKTEKINISSFTVSISVRVE